MLDGWVSGHAKVSKSYFHVGDEPAGDRSDPDFDIH